MVGVLFFVAAIPNVALASSDISGGIYQEADPADPVEDVVIEGTIISIDDLGGTLEIEVLTESGELVLYTVQMPEGFDFTLYSVGDTVDVTSLLSEEGIDLVSDPEGESGEGGGFYCENLDVAHPTASSLAETYGVTYEEVMGWFCGSVASQPESDGEGEEDGEKPQEVEEEDDLGDDSEAGHKVGFGQIMLALHTAETTGESVDELLARRSAGEGWGQIWNDLADHGEESDDTEQGEESADGSETEADDDSQSDQAESEDNKNKDKDKDKDKDKENNGKGKGKGKGNKDK